MLPREAVAIDAERRVGAGCGGAARSLRQAITVGEVSEDQAVVASGVAEGAVVAGRAAGGE